VYPLRLALPHRPGRVARVSGSMVCPGSVLLREKQLYSLSVCRRSKAAPHLYLYRLTAPPGYIFEAPVSRLTAPDK
jgi:hypothetical protein